jgi:hypothetical protein
MRTTSRSRPNLLVAGIVLMPLLLVATLVVRSSFSAFAATAGNNGSALQATSLTLTDDDGGNKALFNLAGTGNGTNGATVNGDGLIPGQSRENCIVLAYAGGGQADITTEVNLDTSASTGLQDDLRLTVQYDAGATTAFGNCSGFTSDGTVLSNVTVAAADANGPYSSAGLSNLTSGSQVTLRIIATLDAATASSETGKRVDADLQWVATLD